MCKKETTEFPEISVIVPVYNTEKFINRCVDSILAQTYRNFELILVDDGSTDKSNAICDEYTKQDSRIRVLHLLNGGVSYARNMGLEGAKGNYVTFVDSDDTIAPNFLADGIEYCQKECLDIFGGCHVRMQKNGLQVPSLIAHTIFNEDRWLSEYENMELLRTNLIASCWGKLIRREFISDVRFKNGMRFGEDLQFCFQLLDKNPRLMAVPEIYYFYWENENSATTQIDEEKLKDVLRTYQILWNHAEKYHFSGPFGELLYNRWLKDFGYLQQKILKIKGSIIKKFYMLSIISRNKLLRSVVKNSNDLYLSRYGFSPMKSILHYEYNLLKAKKVYHDS